MKEVKEYRYGNGQLEYRDNYLNGKRHGLSEWWYINGQLEHRFNCLNGELYGLQEWWLGNGVQNLKNYRFL